MRRSQDLFKDHEPLPRWSGRRSTWSLEKPTPLTDSSRLNKRRSYTQSAKKNQDHFITELSPIPSTCPPPEAVKRAITIFSGEDAILAQYGIYEKIQRIIGMDTLQPKCVEDTPVQKQKEPKEKKLLKNIVYPLCLFLLMFLSGFLGAFCYSFYEYYYGVVRVASSPNSESTDIAVIEFNRSSEKDVIIHQLASSIIQLEERINSMKDEISNSKGTVSDIIPKPSRGVLEELLSSEPDLASSGNLGWVVATPDTADYTVPAHVSVWGLFTVGLDLPHRPAHTTIKGLIQEVGDCWAFRGGRGRLVLGLHRPSHVTGVSLSHIPATISPTGHIHTAPRHFTILAHETSDDLENGMLLGEFEYDEKGPWRQSFTFYQVNGVVTERVEFRFTENYGDPDYTCVYRVHVHGKII